MKKVTISIICCCYHLLAIAQWTQLSSGISADFTTVYFLNDETGFVGGIASSYPYNAVLLKTIDGGQTWDSLSVVLDGGIFGIWFTNDSIGFASGKHVILRTSDQWATWDTVAFGYFFHKLVFLDSLVGFCDYGASFLKTTDGGITWTSLPWIYSDYVGDYDFSSEDSGIIEGYLGQFEIVTTTDGGSNWNTVLTGGAYDDGWSCVEAFSNTKLAAVGYGTYPGWNYNLSNDGGATWTSYPLPIPCCPSIEDVSFSSPDTGFIVGQYILKTTDGGLSWAIDDSTYDKYSSILQQVMFPSTETGYAVGYNGLILKYGSGIAQASGDNISSTTRTLLIRPNPVHDVLQLRTEETGTLRILNTVGETLFSKNLSNDRSDIDVSFLVPAIYYVELLTQEGVYISQFVKE